MNILLVNEINLTQIVYEKPIVNRVVRTIVSCLFNEYLVLPLGTEYDLEAMYELAKWESYRVLRMEEHIEEYSIAVKDIIDDIKNPLMRTLSPIFHQYAGRIKSLKFATLRGELTLTLVIEI